METSVTYILVQTLQAPVYPKFEQLKCFRAGVGAVWDAAASPREF